MTAPLARPATLRADAARNRALLLAAARRHHHETGELALNAIAADAGVGIGTAYRHFPTTQALAEALAIDGLESMTAAIRDTLATGDDADAFARMVTIAFERLSADPVLTGLLASGTFTCADAAAVAGDLYADVATLMARAQAAGAIRPDLSVDDLRRLLCGLSKAATAGPDPVTAPERYAQVLIAGMAPR